MTDARISELVDALRPQIDDFVGARALYQEAHLGLESDDGLATERCCGLIAAVELRWPGRFSHGSNRHADDMPYECRLAVHEICDRLQPHMRSVPDSHYMYLYDAVMSICHAGDEVSQLNWPMAIERGLRHQVVADFTRWLPLAPVEEIMWRAGKLSEAALESMRGWPAIDAIATYDRLRLMMRAAFVLVLV